jgi:hypothetical protein
VSRILCLCDYGLDELDEQLRSKIAVDRETGCWVWTAALSQGYGYVRRRRKTHKAARVIYVLLVGPIPDGLQLDHLCRNRACVHPHHLEPVTSRENTMRGLNPSAAKARQTHCKRGHDFNEENTRINPRNGTRTCRVCHRERERERVQRLRTAA